MHATARRAKRKKVAADATYATEDKARAIARLVRRVQVKHTPDIESPEAETSQNFDGWAIAV